MTDFLRITSRLNEGVLIGGRAAYYDTPPPPSVLRRQAARASYDGILALTIAPKEAEELLRRAIELLVDAFLLDRRRNADLLARAHALGALVEQEFTCRWSVDKKHDAVENPCGILALHSRIGLSPGGRNWGRCSICDADDFQCDHVPGRMYGNRRCQRIIYRWDGDEISFTARPRDPRCFRVWALLRRDQVPPDQRCRHCASCPGRAGPTPDDVDPSRWPDDPDLLIPATIAVSENAAATSWTMRVMSGSQTPCADDPGAFEQVA